MIDKNTWRGYKVFFIPSSEHGKGGEGLLLALAIRHRVDYHSCPLHLQRIHYGQALVC